MASCCWSVCGAHDGSRSSPLLELLPIAVGGPPEAPVCCPLVLFHAFCLIHLYIANLLPNHDESPLLAVVHTVSCVHGSTAKQLDPRSAFFGLCPSVYP